MLTSVHRGSHWKPLSLQCRESFQKQLEKIHPVYQSSWAAELTMVVHSNA